MGFWAWQRTFGVEARAWFWWEPLVVASRFARPPGKGGGRELRRCGGEKETTIVLLRSWLHLPHGWLMVREKIPPNALVLTVYEKWLKRNTMGWGLDFLPLPRIMFSVQHGVRDEIQPLVQPGRHAYDAPTARPCVIWCV